MRPARWWGVCLLAFLGACGEGPAAQSESDPSTEASTTDGAVTDWPAIHLDQIQERLVDGENAARRDYRLALEQCRATSLPVRELGADELERLGTTHVRMWVSPDIEVMRDEQWTLGLQSDAPGDSCLFRLVYSGQYSYADGSVEMGRALGEAAEGAAAAEAMPGGEILPRFALDGAARVPPGYTATGNARVAGHACRLWRGRGLEGEIEQCLWSGGRSFGFDDQDAGEGCSPTRPIDASLGSIVLSQEPVDGRGCRISTRAFTVGAALDAEAYGSPDAAGGT